MLAFCCMKKRILLNVYLQNCPAESQCQEGQAFKRRMGTLTFSIDIAEKYYALHWSLIFFTAQITVMAGDGKGGLG